MELMTSLRRRRGAALALALVLMPICMLLMYMFVDNILLSTRESMRERGRAQTFHMAESGMVIAYDAFRANNFSGTTHNLSGGSFTITASPNNFVIPTDSQVMSFQLNTSTTNPADSNYRGWVEWVWPPPSSLGHPPLIGDVPFTDSPEKEVVRYRCYFTDADQTEYPRKWRIDCQANQGTWQSTHSIEGVIENNAQYVLYSAGDMEDLSRAEGVVAGQVHANGNIYLLPKFMTSRTPPTKVTGYKKVLGIWFHKTWSSVTWPVIITGYPRASTHSPDSLWGDFQANNTPPINVTLSASVESAGKIIRSDNAHKEVARGGGQTEVNTNRVYIASTVHPELNPGPEMVGGSTPMDSNNPKWTTQAPALWGSNVKDAALGARTRDSFDPHALDYPNPSDPNSKGGFYFQRANPDLGGMRLTDQVYAQMQGGGSSVPGVTLASFYNNSENRAVTVFDIDLAAIQWPTNGLIYSTKPVRLYHASILKDNITVVSPGTIYTKGDFNKGTTADGHKSAALVTLDRIYHLSDHWNDKAPQNSWNNPGIPNAPFVIQTAFDNRDNPLKQENFPPHAGMDTGTDENGDSHLVINAALVDGVPAINELNWAPTPNAFMDPNYTDYVHAIYLSAAPGSYVAPWQASVNCAANSDCLLEEFQQLHVATSYPNNGDSLLKGHPNPDIWDASEPYVKLDRQGSVMHLQSAVMGSYTTSPPTWDEAPKVTPYLVRSFYTPWIRTYAAEPRFSMPQTLPKFTPNISTKTLWSASE